MQRVRLEKSHRENGKNGPTVPSLRPDLFGKDDQRINRRGRPPGSRNRVSTLLKDAVILAAEAQGEMEPYYRNGHVRWKKGKGGLPGYLKWLAANEPKAFAGLLSRVIPLHVVGDIDHTHTDGSIKDKKELLDALHARGIPIMGIYQHTMKPPPVVIDHDDNELNGGQDEDE